MGRFGDLLLFMANGYVYLVGAGPGDPELITRKGLRLIRHADVVLYDGLANPLLLSEIGPGCELINVEKRPGMHRVQQEDINELMVDRAQQGLAVVRLKGGDPVIFGRGGEEAEVLKSHNIPFEIVPGITSAIAAPAYAGIPVTQRGISPYVTIVTGTTTSLEGHQQVDWEALAKVGGTLLILMGTSKRREIAKRLIAGGRGADTPVAAVRWGSLPIQHTVRTTLGKMADVDITNPSVIVVGEVAQIDLDWFSSKPLFGRTIAVPRARTQASGLVAQLQGLGAIVLGVRTIPFAEPENWEPADRAISELQSYDWLIFTSANGTDRFLERLFVQGQDVRALYGTKIATIGSATSDRVRDWHLNVELEAQDRASEGVLDVLGAQLNGQRFLLPRPEKTRDVLGKGLCERGATVDEVVVYRTIAPDSLPASFLDALLDNAIDLVTFTSSSTVYNFVDLLDRDQLEIAQKRLRAACIGPITANAATENGFDVAIELDQASVSVSGLAGAIERFLG